MITPNLLSHLLSMILQDCLGTSFNETTLNINSKFDTLYEKVHETACVPLKKSPPKQLKVKIQALD